MSDGEEPTKLGRPEGGGGNGPRAAWWKEYSANPEVKKHRNQYMQKWRERQKRAVLKQWTPATEPPDSDRVVLVVFETEAGAKDVWLGYYEDDGWLLAEGDPVYVTHWMERPKLP